MAKEGVRQTAIPPFQEWLKSKPGIENRLKDSGQIGELYHGVQTRDFTIIKVNGEYRRYSRIPTAKVFFQVNERRFSIHETGYVINPDQRDDPMAVLRAVKDGDMGALKQSRERDSISERSKLNGESRERATLRMIREELFHAALQEQGAENYPNLDNIINSHIVYEEPSTAKRGPDDEGNSFPGIPVIYYLQPARITFTSDMHLPIEVIDGVPQPLYELEEGKFINIFRWK